MLNIMTLGGRMVADPELRYTASNTPVCSFTVACERDFKSGEERQTDFIDCVAWKATAEYVEKYFKKGDLIFLAGRLQSRKWTDQKGNNRISWEVVVNSLYHGTKKDWTAEKAEEDGELPF